MASSARASGADVAAPAPPERALESLIASHYDDVLRYAERRLGDRAEADEVAAEVFVVTWRRLGAVPDDPLPWLYGVARGLTRNRLRAAGRRARLFDRLALNAVAHGPGQEPADSLGEVAVVREAFLRLRERDRELLSLLAWEGLTHTQAAAALGTTKAVISVRAHRARRRLVKELAAAGHSSP